MNSEQREQNDNGNIGKDVFQVVADLARAALTSDTATRRLAAGAIVHTLASAYPGLGAAKAAHGVHVRDYTLVKAQTPCTKVIETTLATGRTVSASIVGEMPGARALACLYDNDNEVCRIEFFGKYQSATWICDIAKAAFLRFLHRANRRHNRTVNKKLRAAAKKVAE